MTFPLAYCPSGYDVLERLRALYERRMPDRILASMEVPSTALKNFAQTHPAGYCAYPDLEERVRFWDTYCAEQADVQDDAIPCAYPSEMDQGLYGALVGGDVRFLCDPATGWISSMVPPVLEDWLELEHLRFDAHHPWFQRYLQQLSVFKERAEGRYGISHFILISGLNFVFELVGATQTYLGLTDAPDTVTRAIELGREINTRVQDAFFESIPLLEGGTCSNMVQWIPGRIVSESVDPFHMTSVEDFERWGRSNLEQIFARFDGGVAHIHANGRHLLESVAGVRGLKALCLLDDLGFPSSFEILPQAQQRTGDLPLIVFVDFPAFQQALQDHRLCGGVLYRVKGVPDVETANECMGRVKSYRLGSM